MKRKCKCGKNMSINVGDSIQNGEYLWFISLHCEHCGEAVEVDGRSVWNLPYEVQQEIINRNGEGRIIAKNSVAKTRFLLKKILGNENSSKDIHKVNELYGGTKNQIKWIKNKLIEKGVNEKDIEIQPHS